MSNTDQRAKTAAGPTVRATLRGRLSVNLRRIAITLVSAGLMVGAYLGVTGASAGARPAGVPTHVPTWAYDDGCSGGGHASPALVRRWLTYAESNCNLWNQKVLRDCHSGHTVYCYAMQYLDTDWNYPGGPVPTAQAMVGNWWLHEPRPEQRRLIYSPFLGGGYLINQTKPATRDFFRSYLRTYFNAYDGMLMDWQSPNLSMELYFSSCGCDATSEIRSNTELMQAHQAMSAALTHRDGTPFLQVDNSLADNPNLEQGFSLLNHGIGVVGLNGEGVPEDHGTLAPFYTTVLDQIAYIANRTNSFAMMLSRGDAGAPYQPQSRRVIEATELLAFSPGHLVDWEDLDEGDGGRLAVWPEEGIYPTQPVQSMRAPGGPGCLAGTGIVCSVGGHNDLRVAPGVFRREFRACYDGGVLFGRCAAIVNISSAPATVKRRWLRLQYGHQITFIGGDVSVGGRIDLTSAPFTPGRTAIPAKDAILLAP